MQSEQEPIADVYLGRRLGEYYLARRIGEGGMGAVYLADSASGEQVALKLIKRGMDTEAILRRFQNERRILGAMNHPNIARLLDAGTADDGVPYFVMEYIEGRPVNRYCDEERSPIAERLRLFQKICSAVDCAHQLQVIHRDIKPENILVTGSGEPKLLDFGIAKILDFELLDASQGVTVTVAPVMTPRYASPEQARGEPVTPASDIYSLGVLLYELLTGRSPYRVTGRSAHAMVDAICRQSPPLPSEVIDRPGTGEASVFTIGADRNTGPDELRRGLAGDLDAILLTALAKDPAQRFASAAEFSADIGRHLEGARVQAHPPRPDGWLARRVSAFVALVVVALALAGVWYFRHSRSGITIRPSVAVLGFENLSRQPSSEWIGTALAEMITTELGAGRRLRTVPGELVARVKLELALPNARTFTRDTLARLRRSLSADYVVVGSYLALDENGTQRVRLDLRLQNTKDGEVVSSVSQTRGSSELLGLVTSTGAILRSQLGVGGVPGADSGSLQDSLPQGDAARYFSEGLERLRRFDVLTARDLLRNAVRAAPGHALSHAALAAASAQLGYDTEARDEAKMALDLSAGLSFEDRVSIQGRYFETTRSWDKAVETYRKLRTEFPDNLEYGLRLAAAQSAAGRGHHALATLESLRVLPSAANDPRVALVETEGALAVSDLARARRAAQHAARSGDLQGFRVLAARAHLLESRVLLQMGNPQLSLAAAGESQRLYEAVGHRQGVAWALNEAAGVLTQLGDVVKARSRYEEALAVCRAIGDQSCIGTDLDSLGVLRRRQGDLRGAVDMHQQAIGVRRGVGDRAGVATALYNLANVWEVIGDLPRARQAASEALGLRRQLAESRSAALTLSRLANIRRRQGELAESVAMNEEAVAHLREIGDRGGIAMALFNQGMTFYSGGDLPRSRAAFEEALAIRREQHDKNNTAQVLAGLALVAIAQDRLPEARSLIEESISLRRQLGELISLAQSRLVLANLEMAANRPDAAESSAGEASVRFHSAHAIAWEAEALLTLARAQYARGDSRAAAASLASASRLGHNVKDPHLLLLRETIAGRLANSSPRLEQALAEATRLGLRGARLEISLVLVQLGKIPAAPVAAEARQLGYLLIARQAAS